MRTVILNTKGFVEECVDFPVRNQKHAFGIEQWGTQRNPMPNNATKSAFHRSGYGGSDDWGELQDVEMELSASRGEPRIILSWPNCVDIAGAHFHREPQVRRRDK